jgi:hypothetical protein
MKKNNKKVVSITENNLVDLIDNIVKEAVAKKKVEWIAENEEKNNLLESRVNKLESFVSNVKITKKKINN